MVVKVALSLMRVLHVTMFLIVLVKAPSVAKALIPSELIIALGVVMAMVPTLR